MRIAVWTCVLMGSGAAFGASSALAQATPRAPEVKPAAAQPTAAKPVAVHESAAVSGKGRAAKPAGPKSAEAETLAIAAERLQSGDDASVRAALGSLMQLGGEPAAQLVIARLHHGLPPLLIEAAVDALVLLDRPSAAPALLELTQHRRVQVRVKVMQALAALRVRSAQSAPLYALDDPNTEVRGAAVDALATVGNARALPALLTAAERGVPGAWQAVGTLAGSGDLKSVFAHVRAGDVAAARPGLDALMRRANLPVDAKLHVAKLVQGLGSSGARECLSDWSEHLPADNAPRLRQGLAQLVSSFVEKTDGAHDSALAAGPAKDAAPAGAATPAKHAAAAPVRSAAVATQPSAAPAKSSSAAGSAPVKPAVAAAPTPVKSSAAAPKRATGHGSQVADAHASEAPAAQGGAR